MDNINSLVNSFHQLNISDTNLSPCVNCDITKSFADIKTPSLYKDSNNLLHIDIKNNISNVTLNNIKYSIFDIFFCFPSIHSFKDNNDILKYDGEVVLIFKNDSNSNYVVLSSLLKRGDDSNSSTLCSKALFDINSYVETNFSNDTDSNSVSTDTKNYNINKNFNINISLDINDLLPFNNTLYNYLYTKSINWFVYKNPISITKSCYSAILPALKRNVTNTNNITDTIFQYNDLNPVHDNTAPIINIVQTIKNNCNNPDTAPGSESSSDIPDANTVDLNTPNIVMWIINVISLIIFIILFIVFSIKNNKDVLKKILFGYCFVIIVLSIIYSTLSYKPIFRLVNMIFMIINILIIIIIYFAKLNSIIVNNNTTLNVNSTSNVSKNIVNNIKRLINNSIKKKVSEKVSKE